MFVYLYAALDTLPLDEHRKNITIYDAQGNVMYETNYKKNLEWTPIDEIPDFIQDAFVGVEDKRFYYHAGFDPIRITKALATNMIHGEIRQGGSSITQQYAKNLFLTNDQNISRKIQEMLIAARLEMQYSKQDILEGYLNTIYFGHGVYGIQAAAEYFFDKQLDTLTIAETAMLIGIPNGPSIYSPFLHLDNAINRQHLILDILVSNNVISEDEKKTALQEPLLLSKKETSETKGGDEYYVDAVIQELNNMDVDLDQEVHVKTYYQPDVQKNLNTAIMHNTSTENELEVAGIIVEPFTGDVLALAGGKDYTISQYNRALYSSRQVASTIKPLLYYCALQQGFTPSTEFISQKTTFKISDTEEYAPTNYSDVYANANITMVNAIALSDNIYAVKTHLFLGEDILHNALLKFNIKQSTPNPSEALGTVNMSLMELSSIYNTFASEGLYSTPSLIQQITSKENILYEREKIPKRLLDRDLTLILNQMLTAPYDIRNQSYTFPSMYGYKPDIQTAVKSGTSDWDSLVMGYNPEYLIGVWSGFDDNRILEKDYYPVSKRIFQETFNSLYENRNSIWYQPSDQLQIKTINPLTGKDATDGEEIWYLKN